MSSLCIPLCLYGFESLETPHVCICAGAGQLPSCWPAITLQEQPWSSCQRSPTEPHRLIVAAARPEEKQWLLFEVPHVDMIWAAFQRADDLSLPSLTDIQQFYWSLNCFDLVLDKQGVGFHLKGRLQVPALPRVRRTTGAKSEGLFGRERSCYLGKKSRSILGGIFCDMPKKMV